MTVAVFIDGAAGTTGLDIAARIAGRAEFALIELTDERRKDPAARAAALNRADVAILCLPDDAARDAVGLIANPHTRVIDASSAHRVAPGWTYGFPELVGRDAVAAARWVSNPGCYATGFVALLAPLVRAGLLPAAWPYACHAVSGYSGGGKPLIARFADDPAIAWRGYALDYGHKHLPEMQAHAHLAIPPLFAPAVVPAYRGMVVEIPLPLAILPGAPDPAQLRAALAAFYAGSPVVTVADHAPAQGEILLRQTAPAYDTMRLHVIASRDASQARLVAELDNLGKGASGAALQNLNLICDLPETAGLVL